MNLVLQRDFFTDESTIGELFDGSETCATLELPKKDGMPGSAIPAGNYAIVLGSSPKFLKSTDPWVLQYASRMPHIVGIPNRSLIMIHWGNQPKDTDGCVLVGMMKDKGTPNFIDGSRQAFEILFPKVERAVESEGCMIQIVG